MLVSENIDYFTGPIIPKKIDEAQKVCHLELIDQVLIKREEFDELMKLKKRHEGRKVYLRNYYYKSSFKKKFDKVLHELMLRFVH
jgi:wyosine [tRNA(Phe)-imidazoG37] synthetase (radical SAM superfamily)